MYGVVWITPPRHAASTDATPSVRRMDRVSYSSPAAAALSVQSMPPTIVARANGNTTGSLSSAGFQTEVQSKIGNNDGLPPEEVANDRCSGTIDQPWATPTQFRK